MNNQDIDMFKKLDTYASPTDLDQLWANIEPSLPKAPERKRILGYYWLIGMALVTVLGAAMWYASHAEAQLPRSVPSVAPLAPITVATPAEPENKVALALSKAAQADQATREQMGVRKFDPQPTTMPNKAVQLPSDGGNQRAGIRTISTSYAGIEPVAQSVTIIRENAASSTISDAQATGIAQEIGMNRTEMIADRTEIIVTEPTRATDQVQLRLISIALLPQAQTRLSHQSFLDIHKRFDPQTGCYDWSGRKGRVRPYIGVYGGAHLPMRKLESKAREFDGWATVRNSTETRLEAVNLGGFVGFQARSGFTADLGFDYLRINERFRATDVVMDTIGQVVTTAFLINAPGDTTFFQDTVKIIETTETTRTTYNRYTFFTVPIGLGYTFTTAGAFKPYFKAGMQISVGTRQKVGMLNGLNNYELFESSNANTATYPFRTKVKAAPFVQVGARIALGGSLEAFGELRYLHMRQDITTDAFGIAQRYKTVGAQVGLRIGL
jgi:hypothetical protein